MNERKFTLNGTPSYRRKLLFIVIGLVIGLCSLLFTDFIVRELANKEQNEMRLWSHAMAMVGSPTSGEGPESRAKLDELIGEITDNNTTIPSIVTDRQYRVLNHSNVPQYILDSPEKLRKELEYMASRHDPIEVNVFNSNKFYIFYSESSLLKQLKYFPYVQLSVISIFIMFAFITFRSSKHDEQNRVWIGMAKETAHQLGTPTSSLLGWIEYLKSQNVEDFVVEEMNKDITRLLKVVDRFSKIGSATVMVPRNIYELVNTTVCYFRARIPKNVELRYNSSVSVPMQAMVNDALFEWVIENLLKNALDALQGRGIIDISIHSDSKWICIDVKDSGKGISKSNQMRIFNPGYTTKTRGWGLGLSLSKRIITDYHDGRIFVLESELDKGTTMRIMLHKL